jgi:glucosamine--fructose-6-phosphate aminotransferase (isomerizing)
MLMLYLLAHALGAPIRIDDLRRVPEQVEGALRLEEEIAARAERYRFMRHAAVVGRGLNYANAFEFALKLMETCYVVAERFSTADFLHGPIAMVEAHFPVFLFAPAGPAWTSLREMSGKLEGLGAETLVITDRSNPEAAKGAKRAIVLPFRLAGPRSLPADIYTPAPYIVPAQLLAAHLAAGKGFDPDRPRTLTKVTKTL